VYFPVILIPTYLLDHVLHIIKIVDIRIKPIEHIEAENSLMILLEVLQERSYREEKHYYGSIAICIVLSERYITSSKTTINMYRALYIRHCYV
jgi:hypothetical protein